VTINREGSDKWSHASFRVAGETLVPDQIGVLLGLEATRVGLKGERISQRHTALRRTSFWILMAPLADSLPLSEHLKWLLDVLEPKHDSIKSIAQQHKADLFCGFSSANGQGGFTLDPGLLTRLATLGIPVELDLHPPDASLEIDPEQPINTA